MRETPQSKPPEVTPAEGGTEHLAALVETLKEIGRTPKYSPDVHNEVHYTLGIIQGSRDRTQIIDAFDRLYSMLKKDGHDPDTILEPFTKFIVEDLKKPS